jgi:hypothetical protein
MMGHSDTGRAYQCLQPRRVAHRTNTTHQYSANPLRTSSSKAIAPFSDVANEAYPRTMSGPLRAGKASAKISAELRRISLPKLSDKCWRMGDDGLRFSPS